MESFVRNVDAVALKAQLNQIMADASAAVSNTSTTAKSTEGAGQCIADFAAFFQRVSEQYGTTPHAVLGQHVVTNVFIFVLERLVQPSLLQYCKMAEKSASGVAVPNTAGQLEPRSTSHAHIGTDAEGGNTRVLVAAQSGRRDALSARRRRLRSDIIRPLLFLFNSLHSALAAEGEALAVEDMSDGAGRGARHGTSSGDLSSVEGGATRTLAASGFAAQSSTADGQQPHNSASALNGLPLTARGSEEGDEELSLFRATASVSHAPLLWKNSSPLNILCNHIAAALESPWLTAVVGVDYATLLLEVLRWEGYARLVTSTYLLQVSAVLLTLLERVREVAAGDAALGMPPGMALEEVGDGRVWVAVPTADDAGVYAQLLGRLLALPQVSSAYPPLPEIARSGARGRGNSARRRHGAGGGEEEDSFTEGDDSAAGALIQRVIRLVRIRHSTPTPDLRLEAHCVCALRQLCWQFRSDHPRATRAACGTVKLLCDFFFVPRHTARHDVWRLEVMQLLTLVMAHALAEELGDGLWRRLRETAGALCSDEEGDAVDAIGVQGPRSSPSSFRALLLLLHRSVGPLMCRVFLQQRQEYSFTSRRELFAFPCAPLQEVFDFGATVLFLCAATEGEFRAATPEGVGRIEGSPHGTDVHGRKRVREGEEEGREGETRPLEVVGPHSVLMLADALRLEFFVASPLPPATTYADTLAWTRRRANAPPLVLRFATAGLRTNSAAVQDVVSDRALFLLHLFAQPCATRACSAGMLDPLVEDVLLPLCSTFGLRMGPLLLAALHGVAPHCSSETQRHVFAQLARRSLSASVATPAPLRTALVVGVREEVAQPCGATYDVLIRLLEHSLVGQLSRTLRDDTMVLSGRTASTVPAHLAYEDIVHSLSGMGVVWDTHLCVVLDRLDAQLAALEDGVDQLCSEVAAGEKASANEDAGTGTLLHALTPVPLLTEELPPFQPLLTASTALLLLRFMVLRECAFLWQVSAVRPSMSGGQVWSMEGEDELAVEIEEEEDGDGRDSAASAASVNRQTTRSPASAGSQGRRGLTFLFSAAAHTVNFFVELPIIRLPAQTDTTLSTGHSSSSDGTGERPPSAEGEKGGEEDSVRSETHDHSLLDSKAFDFFWRGSSSDALASAAAVPPSELPRLVTPDAFLRFLDVAESYIGALLQTDWARQRVEPQSRWTLRNTRTMNDKVREVAPLSPYVCRGLRTYVERALTRVQDPRWQTGGCTPSPDLPSVLRRVAEGESPLQNWNFSSLRDRRTGGSCHGRVSGLEEGGHAGCGKLGTPAALLGQQAGGEESSDAVSALSVELISSSSVALPRRFRATLTYTVQHTVSGLMRRALLLERVYTALRPAFTEASSSHRRLAHQTAGAGPRRSSAMDARGLSGQPSPLLLLMTQCVQLLHLLLRCFRAGLWALPEGSARQQTGLGPGHKSESPQGLPTPLPYAGQAGEGADDRHLLLTSPNLFHDPLRLLRRFSLCGGGRLHYTLLWLCHFLWNAARGVEVLPAMPFWAAVRLLYADVGTVLLHPRLAASDPGQTLLKFTTIVCETLTAQVSGELGRWRPSNPTSLGLSSVVTVALQLSLDTLHVVMAATSRTGIASYAVRPLFNATSIRSAATRLLREQSLLLAVMPGREMVDRAGSVEEMQLPEGHALLSPAYPFLPPALPLLAELLRLLTVTSGEVPRTGETKESTTGVRAAVQVLQVLFSRYRFQIGPALCGTLVRGTLSGMETAAAAAAVPHTTSSLAQLTRLHSSSPPSPPTPLQLFCTHVARLLELWTALMTDSTRADMPCCTPAWQCALLQASFSVLPRCELTVAEVLGRFSFDFLLQQTPYVVRRNAASHVGILFRTFSSRRVYVLHSLLTKARDGVLSSERLLCATSLLAIAEAVRAAPELRVDVLYTLLECCATSGFSQHGLVITCMRRLADWTLQEAETSRRGWQLPPLPRVLSYTQLTRMHVRPLLFMWLCEYRHPLEALPVSCFGYATLNAFIVAHMNVLLPLVLLRMTEGEEGGEQVMTTQPDLFQQLLSVYSSEMLQLPEVPEESSSMAREPNPPTENNRRQRGRRASPAAATTADSTHSSEEREYLREVAALCLLLQYLPSVAVQLYVLAANAPLSVFANADADLVQPPDDRKEGGVRTSKGVDWAQLPRRSSTSGDGRGSAGGDAAGASRLSSELGLRGAALEDVGAHGESGDDAVQYWPRVAQRCLYWLQAQLNTTEAASLVAAGGHVWLQRRYAPTDCVLEDVADAAAFLAPAVSSSSIEVLLFYLQRVKVWPVSVPLYAVLIAAHMDDALTEVARLHRTAAEPPYMVYGTADQLRRVLTSIAHLMASSFPAPTGGSATVCLPRVNDFISVLSEKSGVASEGTQPMPGAGASLSGLAAWQARCLTLLLPSTLRRQTSDAERRDATNSDAFRDEDALTALLLAGDSALLSSLLRTLYGTAVFPTCLEMLLRAPQQLSLLRHVTVRWCTSAVLAEPMALRVVLNVLLASLRRCSSPATYETVCDALLHVWPVAVSASTRALEAEQHGAAATARGSALRPPKYVDHVGEDALAAMRVRQQAGLWPCALQLSDVVAPLALRSAVVASTWSALLRSDAALAVCDWPTRAEHFLMTVSGGAAESEVIAAVETTGESRARRSSTRIPDVQGSVVVVEDSTEEENEQATAIARVTTPQGERKEEEKAQRAMVAAAAAVPADLHTWSRAAYLFKRGAVLAPLMDDLAQQHLRGLLPLLRHACGRLDDGGVGTGSDTAEAAAAAMTAQGTTAGLERGRAGIMSAADAPAAAPFVRALAASVDCLRPLLVRCISVADFSLFSSSSAPAGESRRSGPRALGASATAERREAHYRDAEAQACAVQRAMWQCITQLYSATATDPITGVTAADSTDWMDVTNMGTPLDDAPATASFQLLRALSFCVMHAGKAEMLTRAVAQAHTHTGGLQLMTSPDTSATVEGEDVLLTAEQLVACSLGYAYADHVATLRSMAADADASVSSLAMDALHIWALSLDVSLMPDGAKALSPFDVGVLQLLEDAMHNASPAAQSALPSVIHEKPSTVAALVQDISRDTPSTGEGEAADLHGATLALLADLHWVLRSTPPRTTSVTAPPGASPSVSASSPTSTRVLLSDPSVWRPLLLNLPNEPAFLCRFLVSAVHTFGLVKRSVLWKALLPLLHAELNRAEGTGYGLRTGEMRDGLRLCENLLTPVILHGLCLREGNTLRQLRQAWSGLLEQHVLMQPRRCPRVASLFLKALHACHVVLLRCTRLRGLKGSTATITTTPVGADKAGSGVRCNWPSTLGSVPQLSDTKNAYWLSDITAMVLARAAVAVSEPQLALLFAQLSGESLFGPRTGAPAMSGEAITTLTSALLRAGTAGATSSLMLSGAPYSVVFPDAREEDYAATMGTVSAPTEELSGVAGRAGGRAREREDALRQQTLDFSNDVLGIYAQVQQQLSLDDMGAAFAPLRSAAGDVLASRWRDDVEGSVVYSDGGGCMEGPLMKSDDGWAEKDEGTRDTMASELQVFEEEAGWELSEENSSNAQAVQRRAVNRAALLLSRGLPSAAMDIVIGLLQEDAKMDEARGPRATASFAPLRSPHDAAKLRSIGSEAAWMLSQWVPVEEPLDVQQPSGLAPPFAARFRIDTHPMATMLPTGVPRRVLDELTQPAATATTWSASAEGEEEDHFFSYLTRSFVSLTCGEPRRATAQLRRAEWEVRRQMAPSTFLTCVTAGEALREVRQCMGSVNAMDAPRVLDGQPLSNTGAPSSIQPAWLTAHGAVSSGARATSPRRSATDGWRAMLHDMNEMPLQTSRAAWRLFDSVRHALCQVYGDQRGWYVTVMSASEHALLRHEPSVAARWLTNWGTCHGRLRATGSSAQSRWKEEGGKLSEEECVDLVLRRAQTQFALGRPSTALSLLQSSPATTNARAHDGGRTFGGISAAPPLPEVPRVLEQLVLWHVQLQKIPASQLVRDPFFSRAASVDESGVCSFLLGRLCHDLANQVAESFASQEHRELEVALKQSHLLHTALEGQLNAATAAARQRRGEQAAELVLSDEQLKLLKRRIRELTVDINRQEAEWAAARSSYGLYRRSAINAYSRHLQFDGEWVSAQQAGASAGRLPRARAIPSDHAEQRVHSIFAFTELWLNPAPLDGGDAASYDRILTKALDRIPAAAFLPLLHQLTAQLGDRVEGERLHYTVTRVAVEYPLQVVWPLLALANGQRFGTSREVNAMHVSNTDRIRAAQRVLAELLHPADNAEELLNTLGRSGDASSAKLLRCVVQQAQLLSGAYVELAFDRAAVAPHPGQRYAIRGDMLLIRNARHLSIPPPTSIAESAGDAVPLPWMLSATPHVMRYRPWFTTPGGVNVPKVLLCELSDGQVVRQLVKGGDDLRQDALIQRVFATTNGLLLRRAPTRPLQMRTFTVVPLAPTAGLIEWVENTLPLGEYVAGRNSGHEMTGGAHERYFPGELTSRECRTELTQAGTNAKAEALLRLYQKYSPSLHYFFLEQATSAESFVVHQQTYTRSVAVSSMVGYVVGLGDRHVNNILLDKMTAEVVHIDLGIAFDQGRLMAVPEQVPFRMTRNIIDGLGVRGTEGALRPCAEAALRLLRSKRPLLRTLFTSIMHDPLARWVISLPAAAELADTTSPFFRPQQQQQQQQGPGLLTESTRLPPPMRTSATTADAARTLARVDAKLRGVHAGEALTVDTQVRKLIEEAQSVEKMAIMYVGWSQWI